MELYGPYIFLKTVHRVHASECIPRRCDLFLASHFSILLEQKFLKKGNLTKTCQKVSDTIGAASTYHHPSGVASADAWYVHPFGAVLAHTHQGFALEVYKLVGSTPLLLVLWGS